jgi:hypothetical protein
MSSENRVRDALGMRLSVLCGRIFGNIVHRPSMELLVSIVLFVTLVFMERHRS